MRVLALFTATLFLGTGAYSDDALPRDAADKATYDAQCAMCHGETGKGDGMAAAALTPAPPDFTTAEFQESRTEEQLRETIVSGKGAMPGYSTLEAELVTSLIAYIRSLAESE